MSGVHYYEHLSLSVEVVTDLERLVAIKGDYDRLNTVTKNTLPFLLHEWHVTWWKHLAQRSAAIRDHLFIHVARNLAGECVGIVPFVLTQRPGVGVVNVTTVSMLGADPYITELRMPLIDPAEEASVAWAVTQTLARDSRWDWIHWSGLNQSPLFAETIAAADPIELLPPTMDYVLDLPATWEELRSNLKRNIRESLRHCYNSLKRDNLTFTFTAAESPEDVREGLDHFFRLHEARSNAEKGIEHANRFGSATAKSFLIEVMDQLARRGVARVLLLRINGEVVAARPAFVVNNSIYLYFSGYDPNYGKYSVMTTMTAEAIKHAIEKKMDMVNLSAGTDVSKTRWGPRAIAHQDAIGRRSRPTSRVAWAAYMHARGEGATPRFLAPLLKVLPRRNWV